LVEFVKYYGEVGGLFLEKCGKRKMRAEIRKIRLRRSSPISD